jgi:hypothetical protein
MLRSHPRATTCKCGIARPGQGLLLGAAEQHSRVEMQGLGFVALVAGMSLPVKGNVCSCQRQQERARFMCVEGQ